MFRKNKLKKLLLFAIIIFLLFDFVLIAKKVKPRSFVNVQKNPNSYISERVKSCNTKDSYTTCLKEASNDFLENFKLKEILDVFEKNERQPEFFSLCHTALHFLGQGVYRKEKNVQEGLSQCSSVCFLACQHGVLEGYLKERNLSLDDDEVLKKKVLVLCQRDAKKVKSSYNECLHGLGHALMFFTEDELPRSLKICDGLSGRDEQQWCYSGAFMENSTSSTNKDHPTKYLKKDDPIYPCNVLDSKYLDMCYALQGFYFAKISNFEIEKTITLCGQVPKSYQASCFRSIGQERVGFTQDLAIMKDGCDQIEEGDNREACLQGVIVALAERYKGDYKRIIEFCTILDKDDKPLCYQQLKGAMTDWIIDKDELKNICQEIPEEEYKEQCLNMN